MKRGHIARIGLALVSLSALLLAAAFLWPSSAQAHGERTQEPSLRMRTVLWHDTQFSGGTLEEDGDMTLRVNEEMTITGRFRIFEQWPEPIPQPDRVYLNVLEPGPRLTRVQSFVNGVFTARSFRVEKGGDYEYRLVLKARETGRYHVHPMLSVENIGGVAGPGFWVDIKKGTTGYFNNVTTLEGDTINVENFGLKRIAFWWIIWSVLAVAWFFYWYFRRGLFVSAVWAATGNERALVRPVDIVVGLAFMTTAALLVLIGFFVTARQFPNVVALSGGEALVPPLERPPQFVEVEVERARYAVVGRSITLDLTVTNTGDNPIQIGEFFTANIRFHNPDVPGVAPAQGFEEEDTFTPTPAGPILPGETKSVRLDLVTPLWRTLQLTDLHLSPESKIGGLLVVYDSEGNRNVVSIGSTVIPVFEK